MGELADPTAPLTATGNLRRRMVVSAFTQTATTLAAVAAVAVLGLLILTVVAKGGSVISWDFITTGPPAFGEGGGIAPAIVGSALMIAVATVIAMPIGVLVAIYLTEFANPRIGNVIQTAIDMLNGLPSIVVGLFVFGLLVVGHHQSGFAASFALAIIMLPLIARSTQEMLLLVPAQLREAADALGVARWRSVVGIVVPSALGGIVTGTVLAVARAAGETAPVLLLSSIFRPELSTDIFGVAIPNIPMTIFTASEAADAGGTARAWGAALVLLTAILFANIAARSMLARSRRKLTR
jgi:phosphate transport system permease protein